MDMPGGLLGGSQVWITVLVATLVNVCAVSVAPRLQSRWMLFWVFALLVGTAVLLSRQ